MCNVNQCNGKPEEFNLVRENERGKENGGGGTVMEVLKSCQQDIIQGTRPKQTNVNIGRGHKGLLTSIRPSGLL